MVVAAAKVLYLCYSSPTRRLTGWKKTGSAPLLKRTEGDEKRSMENQSCDDNGQVQVSYQTAIEVGNKRVELRSKECVIVDVRNLMLHSSKAFHMLSTL